MRNRILLLSIVCFSIGFAQAQTTEELTVLKEAKATELTSLEAQLKDPVSYTHLTLPTSDLV